MHLHDVLVHGDPSATDGESHHWSGHVGEECRLGAGQPSLSPLPRQPGIERSAAPRVEVVYTLAAGDVFHGAFALALLEGKCIADAARFACVAASLKCTKFGGRLGCPTRAEVDQMVAATYPSA